MPIEAERLRVAQRDGMVLGVIPTDGVLRTRLEIDTFIKDAQMTNLYLLALQELKDLDWRDRFSFFQIAGIHGKPYTPWDNVSPDWEDLERAREERRQEIPNRRAGYCSHGSNLFPTWHRAYLAMLEQTIYLKMLELAEQYPEPFRRQYMEAANRFGLPYWDPFLVRRKVTNQYGYPIYKCGVPIILMTLNVRVRMPKSPNTFSVIENPLYCSDFPSQTSPWDEETRFSWKAMFDDVAQMPSMAHVTIRAPSAEGTTDHKFLNNTLTNGVSQSTGPALPLGGKLYRILNGPPITYTQMANSAFVDNQMKGKFNGENSLEGFHNDIHNMCGTGAGRVHGHMGWNEFAAFDPIFYLHHTNIDRLCAIFQALNEGHSGAWWESQQLLERASYVTAIGEKETPTTPLIPFRKHISPNGRVIWWNSDNVRECRSLGYTYPEISRSKSDSGALRQWVVDNYEWTTISGNPPPFRNLFTTVDLDKVEAFPEALEIDGRGPAIEVPKHTQGFWARLFNRNPPQTISARKRYKHMKGLISDRKMTQWNMTIKVHKFGLGGSFTIYVFLGPFSENPRTWDHSPRLVGIDGIFATRNVNNCENCRDQRENGLIDSDVIPLTTPLVAYWKSRELVGTLTLKSLEPIDVKPFLARNLRWRVLDHNGNPVSPDSIPYFCIDIGSQITHLPYDGGEAPRYEEETIHPELGVRRIPRENPRELAREHPPGHPHVQPRPEDENPFIERSE